MEMPDYSNFCKSLENNFFHAFAAQAEESLVFKSLDSGGSLPPLLGCVILSVTSDMPQLLHL